MSSFPVYVVKGNHDSLLGQKIVGMALKSMATHGPLWTARAERSFSSLIILDTVPSAAYFVTDKCCLVNPWNVAKYVSDLTTASTIVAASLVGASCQAMLLNGRFGEAGIKNQQGLGVGAQIRFLRRFLSGQDKTDILAAMSLYREHVVRTRRKSYDAIIKREFAKMREMCED